MNIDWDKAPEGTTHANPKDVCGIWRRVLDGCSFYRSADEWVPLHPEVYEEHKHQYVKKP